MLTRMKPLIVEQVVKRFGSGHAPVTALDQIDLAVEAGDFLAIMGPSGSGKSTLLHLMAGLTHADAGRVLVRGEDLGKMSDSRLTRFRSQHIGLVFQSFNLIPTLTALENVALPLRLHGDAASEAPQRAAAVLERLGMARRAGHRPDAMSGGEQQRVAIARALVTRPAVILADEPTGNLDSTNSRTICQLLRDLNQNEGATIVMVTHEPSVAVYAREVVFIRDGRVADRFETDGADAAVLAERYQTVVNNSDAAAPVPLPERVTS
jgi:putative ABC transport system ATP-binding protein